MSKDSMASWAGNQQGPHSALALWPNAPLRERATFWQVVWRRAAQRRRRTADARI